MIFVNRHRIIQNSGVIKDPTKYWYVEKYVYGVLKETIEVPLGTSTTFSALSSGYDDDEFYGWSISSTSTSRTFTNTASYSNTTTAVKNKLDSDNTLKIYAVYSYIPINATNYIDLKLESSVHRRNTYEFCTLVDTTILFSGYQYTNASTGQSYDAITVTITAISGESTSFTVETHSGHQYMTNAISKDIKKDSHIKFTLICSQWSNQGSGGTVSSYMKLRDKNSNATFYPYGKSYRVVSHT